MYPLWQVGGGAGMLGFRPAKEPGMILCKLSVRGTHASLELLRAHAIDYDHTLPAETRYSAVRLCDPANRIERVDAEALFAWLVEEGVTEEWARRAVLSVRESRLGYVR